MGLKLGLPGAVVSPSSVKADALPTGSLPVSITTPAAIVARSGTFTPVASSVLLDIDISHQFIEPLGGNARWYLYTGPTGMGQLTPTVATGPGAPITPVVAGASVLPLGSIGSLNGALHASPVLTGLTPGTPVQWEVSVAVIGGYQRIPGVSNGPFSIAFASALSNYPDQSYWGAIRLATTGLVQLIKARHVDRYEDVLVGSPLGVASAGVGNVAMTPDGTKCVVTNEAVNTVSVIVTGNNSGAAPSVQGTYTPPGTAPAPCAVAISPDGASAWIGLIGLGQVIKMTVATGAFGSAISVGGNVGDPGSNNCHGGIVISSDGVSVYAFNPLAKTVSKITAATGVVAATCSLATAAGVGCITPDNSTLYCASTTKLYQIRTSDMTLQNTVNVPANFSLPHACAILPDGRSMLISQSTTTGGNQVQHINLPALTQLAYWQNPNGAGGDSAGYDIAVTPNGCIYVVDDTSSGINIWPGGRVLFSGNQPYAPGELRFRATPVS